MLQTQAIFCKPFQNLRVQMIMDALIQMSIFNVPLINITWPMASTGHISPTVQK